MFTSFSTALSALAANSVGVDVVGNNLANLNTTGYKSSVVSFQDLVAHSLGAGGGTNQVGLGVGKPATTRQFTQGAIQLSGGALDAAIEGDGFFVVRDRGNQQLFTRAGNFRLDASGNLITGSGAQVLGWGFVNGQVNTNSAPGAINLPVGAVRPPKATTQMSIDLNLNAGAAIGDTFSSPIEVVDSLGAKHVLTAKFTKKAANQWDYAVSIPGDDLSSGTAGAATPIAGASGSLTFDGQGRLTTPSSANGTVNLQVTGLKSGAADLAVEWGFYGQNGEARLTQFSQPSATSGNANNGLSSGQITRISLNDGGSIIARYSNGEEQVVAQLALATIRNPESLISVGENNLQASSATAAAALGLPGTGGRGKIMGGALEASTVDIAREFTNLIVLQRSYQANARVITTTDELSQETINLKR